MEVPSILAVTIAVGLLLWTSTETEAIPATLGKPCWDDTCEFQFRMTLGSTLTRVGPDGGSAERLSLHPGGCLKPEGAATGSACLEVEPNTASSRVLSGDGRYRSVLLVNGQFPGPTMEVPEGATIIVHAINEMSSVSTAIHWHGLSMKESQWMDGTAFMTQCPIPPGHTFTYRFVATPSGTHWYHPHLANLRRDGHYGLIVIHESRPVLTEFPLILSDWHESSGLGVRITNFRNGFIGNLPAPVSSLINGRGRHRTRPEAPLSRFQVEAGKRYRFRCANVAGELGYVVSIDQHTLTIVAWDGAEIKPLEVDSFNIFPGERVDFEIHGMDGWNSSWIRAVSLTHAGAALGGLNKMHQMGESSSNAHREKREGHLKNRETHIDPHEVSGNSSNTEQIGVDHSDGSVVGDGEGTIGLAQHGEDRQRTTVVTTMNHHEDETEKDKGTAHMGMHMGNPEDFTGLAFLSYGSKNYPVSSPTQCTETNQCRIFNCFRSYSHRATTKCIDLKQIQSSELHDVRKIFEKPPKRDIFLNVATNIGTSVNSLRFVEPLAPFFQSYSQGLISCKEKCSTAANDCWCSQNLVLQHDETINLIMSNIESEQHKPSAAHADHTTGHPMHLHGYRFAIIAQGFATYNQKSGNKESDNKTIQCESPFCRTPSWNLQYPLHSLHLSNPPLKDTVLVPPGGFVVVRLRANNPGCWLFHCHMIRDLTDGMALYLEVSPEKVKAPPPQLPPCTLQISTVPARLACNTTTNAPMTSILAVSKSISFTIPALIGVVIGSVLSGMVFLVVLLFLTRWCQHTAWTSHISLSGSKRAGHCKSGYEVVPFDSGNN